MDLSTIGERIRCKRKDEKMSQDTLAEKIGISDKRTISDWENGKNIPKLENIIKLADALGCDPEFLVGSVEKPTITTSWIAEKIPLSEKAINYLVWLNSLKDRYPDQFRLESGMIDAVLCALNEGVYDLINNIRWDAVELMNSLIHANLEDEKNRALNHKMLVRQSFCNAFGSTAFNYIDDIVTKEMHQRRKDFDEALKAIKDDEQRMSKIHKRREELGISLSEFNESIDAFVNKGVRFDEAMAFVLGVEADWINIREDENGNI